MSKIKALRKKIMYLNTDRSVLVGCGGGGCAGGAAGGGSASTTTGLGPSLVTGN